MSDVTTNTPAEAPTFQLEPPQPVRAVPVESAGGQVKLKPEEVQALDQQVKTFIDDVTTLDSHDPRFLECVQRIHAMGSKDIEASASVSNRMLERPVKAMKNGVLGEGTTIANSLVDLRRTVEGLDPSRQGDLLAPRKLLSLIPFGNRLLDYFDQYQSSQAHLNAIIEALKGGQDELIRDNAAIEQEKLNLWELMERLEKYIYIGKQLDVELNARVQALEARDAEKARVVREEMLFYIRQKVMDLLTQMSVNIQGYLALDLIRKNNLELIKGVDRATTTTVSALRTAVIVAQALANQKLVLDQITALNSTTSSLIEGTSELLKQQTGRIHEQAVNSTVELDKLKRAFANIYQTMDAISTFKTQALDSMQQTVLSLSTEVDKAQTYVERTRQQEAATALGSRADGVQL